MGITAKKEEKKHLLSHEETLDLIQKVQNGDEEARDKFVNGNLRLVLSVIKRFYGRGENLDDLFYSRFFLCFFHYFFFNT